MSRAAYNNRRLWSATFRVGFSSLFDVRGALTIKRRDLYRDARTVAEVDARSLAGDWAVVGRHLQTAINRFEQESSEKREAG